MAARSVPRANWRFTWFFSTIEDVEDDVYDEDQAYYYMTLEMAKWADVGFLFAGKEHCPTTGKVHFQGFVHFNVKNALSGYASYTTGRLLGLQQIRLLIRIGFIAQRRIRTLLLLEKKSLS